ncbi:hypothetical protein QLS91_00180 [Flavobacterium sp. LB2P84]|uniref:hypothetical protein n=1 Tax=Flavobacterium yafengii TaxID=3041253 RepID=UPI0024A8A0FF|nr:hypothetical protein [Flavobacterium yafengii]MDI6031477.1 hypothetical protein [Flavobacterium yafengii]
MKNEEIRDIIAKNDDDKMSFYLSTLLSKCKDIEKENNFIALLMIILILLFYSTNFAQLESLQIGPLSVKDVNSVKVFIPLVFSFLIFRYILINNHKGEIERIIKNFTKEFFNYEDMKIDINTQIDDFTRTILPISNYAEISHLTTKGISKFGCFGSILILPLTLIVLIPFFLEYIWIKDYLNDFPKFNFFQKASIILSIWINIVSIYYIIHRAIISYKENV